MCPDSPVSHGEAPALLLECRDLRVKRGGWPVLERISFVLRSGEALILRGANGIGKTSLLRSLAGLQPLAGGALSGSVDDIAYGAHADGLKSVLSVDENLQFWADVFGAGPGLVAGARSAFDLDGLRGRAAGGLSAGQKRRLSLARLMVTGRRIWVLDEPTVSLDTGSVALFASAVRAHLAGGGAAIMATHIDLGLGGVGQVLELDPYRARWEQADMADLSGDEAFL